MTPDFSKTLNDDFRDEVVSLPKYLLDDSVSWIQNNLEPDDVFSAEQLETWAENNGYKLEV
jgi:hypothetical protein